MIQFKNVSKRFGRVRAVDDMSLDFPEGKIIGIFGPNGAGKSTMLKIISGLNYADEGKVTVDGRHPWDKRAEIAFLPEINHLYSWWTLKHAADFTRAFYPDWDENRYRDLMIFLNINDNMKLDKISKGQLAKCKLALTLSRQSPYLLMDEPFSGIDIMTRADIVKALIRDYNQGNQTIIISTHEIDEIESLVDYVMFIDQGRIRLQGDAEELRTERQMSLVEIMKEAFKDAKD